jgi:hypothetical protein
MVMLAHELPVHLVAAVNELNGITAAVERVAHELGVEDAAHPTLRTILDAVESALDDLLTAFQALFGAPLMFMPDDGEVRQIWALLVDSDDDGFGEGPSPRPWPQRE